jgi:hypothetical protein
MGLFDFFRKKPKPPDQPEAVREPVAPTRPHCHHYTFAHHALRQMAFERPLTCLGVLASPDATRFLCDLWGQVDQHCRRRGETSTINPSELVVHTGRVGDFPCAVVEMPEPWFVTGAHFVGLVLGVPLDQLAPDLDDPPLYYYTLEKGASFDDTERTVLGAWTREGSHLNYGTGPEPNVAAFVRAIEKQRDREE